MKNAVSLGKEWAAELAATGIGDRQRAAVAQLVTHAIRAARREASEKLSAAARQAQKEGVVEPNPGSAYRIASQILLIEEP